MHASSRKLLDTHQFKSPPGYSRKTSQDSWTLFLKRTRYSNNLSRDLLTCLQDRQACNDTSFVQSPSMYLTNTGQLKVGRVKRCCQVRRVTRYSFYLLALTWYLQNSWCKRKCPRFVNITTRIQSSFMIFKNDSGIQNLICFTKHSNTT